MKTHTPTHSLSQGQAVLRRYVETLPGVPGVYRMLDAEGAALYIGKAKNLKHRVASYLQVERLGVRLQRMVALTAAMEITTTGSEAEALLLEANLVKKLSPRYNILLKDDKSFPYILLSGDHEFPRILKYRGAKTGKGKYFGPFTSARAVDETITLLQKAFLLRPCADAVFKHRARPCLQYQIKRCSAPCVGKISAGDYAHQVKQAQDFLAGKSQEIRLQLVEEMQELSLSMQYEKARVVRDRIQALAQVQQQRASSIGNADLVALVRQGKDCCIQIHSIRGGQNWGSCAFFPQHVEGFENGDIISAFLADFYQSQSPPGEILVSHMLVDGAVLEEALALCAGYKVDIAQPVRGKKRQMMNQLLQSASETLARQRIIHADQRAVMEGVQKLFGLEDIPKRIEVYDNSHISGAHAVGAMIVAGLEGFRKTGYRKFNIKRTDAMPGDDYAMLREVLLRRFRPSELQAKDKPVPDLMLIDGGAGHVSTATKIFEELGIQGIVYAGIAKGPDRNAGREQFFMPGRESFQLPEHDPVLHYLQRLRDEAHRFAVGFHKSKRSKALRTSVLDAISGIGPERKKALLHHFGSARAVSAASVEELQKVEGISKAAARSIYAHFHGQ